MIQRYPSEGMIKSSCMPGIVVLGIMLNQCNSLGIIVVNYISILQ